MKAADVPVIITCRDRLAPLRELVDWCERAGHPIMLLDNASTYPPLLDYFEQTAHEVVRLDRNVGPRAPWASGLLRDRFRKRWHVVTDPDLVPTQECPLDAVGYMHELLLRYPRRPKVGLGLVSDDLPAHYPHAEAVRLIESEMYLPEREVEPGVFASAVDTTFALYRPGGRFEIHAALRLGAPYLARHWPWYENPAAMSEDEAYYQAHAEAWNNWHTGALNPEVTFHVERIRRGEREVISRPGPMVQLKQAARRVLRRT